MVAVANGNRDAHADLEPLLDHLTADPNRAQLADVLRRILAGDRDSTLAENLDDTDTTIVTTVLQQLSPATTPPSAEPQTAERPHDADHDHPQAP